MSSKTSPAVTNSEKAPAKAVAASTSSTNIQDSLMFWGWLGAYAYFAFVILRAAYSIRLGAIETYGRVIHEFDPYFNYRATEVRDLSVVRSCIHLICIVSLDFFSLFLFCLLRAIHSRSYFSCTVSLLEWR